MQKSPDSSAYRREAETFVALMRDLVPTLQLDYSADSIQRLERLIAEQFDPPGSAFVGDQLPLGVGCYLGEVVVRTIGGHWNREDKPEINRIGRITAIFPLQKAVKRFSNGPQDSLLWYYENIRRYASGERVDELHHR